MPLSKEVNCPVVLLSSGQKLTLLRVMLYDEEGVQEVAKLRAQATKSLGGGSLGVGVLGTPSWALLGEATALSMVSGFLSGVSQKQAMEMLRAAQTKSETVTQAGVFFEFGEVTNSQRPHPHFWSATVESTSIGEQVASADEHRGWLQIPQKPMQRSSVKTLRRHVHNGDEFVNVETDIGQVSIRWDSGGCIFPTAKQT
jgi:hypothetical protein